MDDIPQEFSGDLLNRIRSGLLRVDSKHRDGITLNECLKESYDVYAGLLQESGRPLDETLLTETIPAWVFQWAVARTWLPYPPQRRRRDKSKRTVGQYTSSREPVPEDELTVPFGCYKVTDWYRADVIKRLGSRIPYWQAESLAPRAVGGFSKPEQALPKEGDESTQTTTAAKPTRTSPSWPETRAKFLHGAEEYANLFALWEARQDLWTFRDDPEAGEAATLTDSESVYFFKETAAIAVSLLGHSGDPDLRALAGTLRQPWHVWLNFMRREKRGFSRVVILRGSQFRAAAERKQVDLSGVPLSENGTIGHLFKEAADFCADLEIRENVKVSVPPAQGPKDLSRNNISTMKCFGVYWLQWPTSLPSPPATRL
jgi:hypothetical protein